MEMDFDKLSAKGNSCLEEIKRELDLRCNNSTGRMVGRVLHTIRNSLTYEQSADLIQQLPDDIKIIYVSDWKLKNDQIILRHLDGMVKEVIKNDREHAHQVFHNEVSALNAILITLKILSKYTDILSNNFFDYTLKQELDDALTEAA